MTTIDIYCHLATASRTMVKPFCRREYEPYDLYIGADSAAQNAKMLPAITPLLTEPAARIEHLDRMSIDHPRALHLHFRVFYWAPPRAAAEAARIQNDNLAAAAAANPDRFLPLGANVPLQDVDLAIAEMDRVVDVLGFRGLQIGGTVDGHKLDHPGFRPF